MTITLITGANKGLGFETARQLIAAGHTVYLTARDPGNAERAAKELGGHPLVLDVTDDDSVQAAAATIAQEHGVLDVLVNNAGINGGMKPAGECTGADLARVLDTNVVGMVRVLHAFVPLLEHSESGVVVNVGSGLGSFARVHDTERMESKVRSMPYTTSKAAVSMLTIQYARAYPGLRVNVVDPGFTATEMNGYNGTQTIEQGVAPIVQAALFGPDGPTGSFLGNEGICPW